mgnify:CR=1 FL=1
MPDGNLRPLERVSPLADHKLQARLAHWNRRRLAMQIPQANWREAMEADFEMALIERDFVEQVIMGAGRPVIILPAKGDAAINLEKIVVGWDGGREAARAAFDSMPLLRAAKEVRIVRADPQKDPGLRGTVPGADLAETLARHGIKSETQGFPTDGYDAGQALLRCADDWGAGLVVMGAYGHSRLTEFIFGGATRFVLSRQNRPVFMSH